MAENSVAFGSVRNLDLTRYNDGASDIDAEVSLNARGSIIENPRECSVAITRFRCPLTSAPIHKIKSASDSDYQIDISVNVVGVAGAAAYEYSGTAYMSPHAVHSIYSPSDYVEEINRTLARAWYNLVDGNAAFSSFVELDSAVNQAFSTAGSLAYTTSIGLVSTTTYGVQLSISNFTQVGAVGSESDLINIDLQNGVGSVCRVASGVILEAGKSYIFSTGGQKDMGDIDETLDATYSYQPIDSFLKFSSEATNGNWIVRISPCGNNSLNITCNVSLGVYAPPKHASDTNRFQLPNLLPNVSLNAQNYTVWTVAELFLRSNMKIRVGNKLKEFLSISKRANSNTIRFPITSLSANLDQVVSFTADASKVFAINQLNKLLIFSNSIPVEKDISAGDVRSFALTSYTIPSDQIERATEIEYSTDAGTIPWRRYDLRSDTPLESLDISARVQYVDGDIETLQLSPGQIFTVMLSVFKK